MAEKSYVKREVECPCKDKHELWITFESIMGALDASDPLTQTLSYDCPNEVMKDNPLQIVEITFTPAENPNRDAATIYKVVTLPKA